jgi:NAD+ diphosphatase
VREVSYLASQAWPFPSSLMLGFGAQAEGREPHADGVELTDVRWFEREQVEAAAAGEILLPPSYSIARRLIDGWLVELTTTEPPAE